MPKRVTINHPLLNRLRKLDKVAARRFPGEFFPGFGSLGLILNSQLKHGGYYCTPTNTLAFASTGGDGVHFSFLVDNGKITDKSPVVITIPTTDHPNYIGGESLFDFLCLGYYRGYFGLGNAGEERFFEAYSSGKWPLSEVEGRLPDWDGAIGYGVSDYNRKVLEFLIAELGLSPWKGLKQKFERLQKLYYPMLDIPEEGKGLG